MRNTRALRTYGLFVALTLVVVSSPPAARTSAGTAEPAAPLAVLISCDGEVTVLRKGGVVKGAFGLPLEAGDEIRTGAQAQAEILFDNGNYVSLGAGSAMQVKGSKHEATSSTKPMGDNGFEVAQNFLKLKSPEGTSSIAALRSGRKEAELHALSPQRTRVLSTRPTFVWEFGSPEEELQITIYGENGILWRHTLVGVSQLTYPDAAPPLTPGATYSWTVETTDPLRVPPLRSNAAFFEVITVEEQSKLGVALEKIGDGAASAQSQHVMRASVFFAYNLLDDAVKETEQALALAPENTTLQSILARLYAESGRTDRAAETYGRILDKQ